MESRVPDGDERAPPLTELVATQRRTGADAITAPVYPRFGDEAPAFLAGQGFEQLWGTPVKDDGAAVSDADELAIAASTSAEILLFDLN